MNNIDRKLTFHNSFNYKVLTKMQELRIVKNNQPSGWDELSMIHGEI